MQAREERVKGKNCDGRIVGWRDGVLWHGESLDLL